MPHEDKQLVIFYQDGKIYKRNDDAYYPVHLNIIFWWT